VTRSRASVTLALGLALAVGAGGCSRSATVSLKDDPPLQGFIVGGSPDGVALLDGAGERRVVRRDQITGIDHPGSVAATAGLVLLGIGIFVLVTHTGACEARPANCAALAAPPVLGATLLAWGGQTGARSRAAARDTSLALPLPPPPAPKVDRGAAPVDARSGPSPRRRAPAGDSPAP
jgi:hypothetical protein